MSDLVEFDHLIPFEADLNPEKNGIRHRVFSTFYHFGAKVRSENVFEILEI